MPKEMISIPAGNLLSVAKSKGVTTLSALKEKTGVDRKTLRSINAGKPVKQTTLQSIANKLRIPIEHLLASNSVNKNQKLSGGDEFQFSEIKLQRLDSTALRKLAGDTDYITWSLNVDQMSDELEATLLKLQNSLNGWFQHLHISDHELSDPQDKDRRRSLSPLNCLERLPRWQADQGNKVGHEERLPRA